MKRIYLLMILFVALVGSASARTINLKCTMVKPTNNTPVTVGTQFPVQITWTNMGPDAIMPGDSLLYVFTGAPSGTIYYRAITTTKNMNDTMNFSANFNFSTAQNGNLNFCFVGVIAKGSANTSITDNDTTNNRACTNIIISGGTSTGVPQVSMNEDNGGISNLAIIPNPATDDVKFNFVSNSAAEVNAKITDITGRVVYTHNFGKAYQGQSNYSLNVSQLNAGIYFIEIGQEGRRAVGKLIKQ